MFLLKACPQPGLVGESCFDLLDIIHRALIVPAPTKPPAKTPPDIARVIAWIAWERGGIAQIGGPAFITGANDAVHVFGVEGGVRTAHGQGILEIKIFQLKNTVALVTALAIPCSWWAKGLV